LAQKVAPVKQLIVHPVLSPTTSRDRRDAKSIEEKSLSLLEIFMADLFAVIVELSSEFWLLRTAELICPVQRIPAGSAFFASGAGLVNATH